ncbi:MAG: hypothetical protein JO026_02795 [Patescibacteria group bacterium]|nr:hypothetical protein [Patescibacteria group bacterium]
MVDSFLLSAFAFLFFLFAILVYRQVDFAFLKQGEDIRLSKNVFLFIVLITITVFGTATWFIMSFSGPFVLQTFYICLFAAGTMLSMYLLFPKRFGWYVANIGIISLTVPAILVYHSQLLENIFMAFSLLWVGPVIFKKFRLTSGYVLAGMSLFSLINIYDVYLASPSSPAFGDETLLLNGLISFGNVALGMGDFFLAYIAVNAVQKHVSMRTAVALAFFIAFARFCIRGLFPYYQADIAYSVVITFGTLIIFASRSFGQRGLEGGGPRQG